MSRAESINSIVNNFVQLKRTVFCQLNNSEDAQLTPAQTQVLMVVSSGSSRIADIAKSLQMTGSAVTQHVNQLVAKNIVTRTESLTDRREQQVELTDEGSAMLQKRRKQFADIMAHETAYLSDSELQTFADLFTKINTKG